ncbi:MAG TPA: acetyltransferase [Nitrospirota bacterium]|nr:acetyltransferase [Nitrospirota bacterium]
MMKKVIVFGNGRWAEFVSFCLTHDSSYEVAGYTVDAAFIREPELFGVPVVPFDRVETVFPPAEYAMLVAVSYQGMNRLREEKYLQAKAKGYPFINYISSKALTWPGLAIGENCLVFENASLNPFIQIGNNVTIGAGVLIGHHTVVHDHCFIASGTIILGSVTVGPYCLVGPNVTIKEKITIGRDCVIGAGVSILKDTQERGVYVGKAPELLPKPSDSLRTWMSWPAKTPKSGKDADAGNSGGK